jgi:hypothetical protein
MRLFCGGIQLLKLIGIVTLGSPVLLVVEHCPNGSLDVFLRERTVTSLRFAVSSKLQLVGLMPRPAVCIVVPSPPSCRMDVWLGG